MNQTVIYHSADFDGIFCREIAKKFLPDATLIGWNHGDPQIKMPEHGDVYILDLSPECLDASNVQGMIWDRIIWIDHHKTAIEQWQPPFCPPLKGYRIDGVAACRLAWQWFAVQERREKTPCCGYNSPTNKPYCVQWNPGNNVVQCHNCGEIALPEGKGRYYDRVISEPLAVRLAGEYDIWDKRDPNAEVFQFGLRSRELDEDDWRKLLCSHFPMFVESLCANGRLLQRYQQQHDASIVNHRSFIIDWEGLRFLTLNTARCNSLTFTARDVPETGHDALLAFYYDGRKWTVSLYHARHRTDLDLSTIARKYGGGGHRGACGFTAGKLPFLVEAK